MNPILRTATLAALSILLLSGCSIFQSASQRAMCPAVNVLANTASLTAFKNGMENDPSAELYKVEVTGVRLSCSFDKDEGTTDSDIEISLRASRAPNGDTSNHTVPYYVVSVLNGATILDKHIYAATFSFQPGEATTQFTAEVPSMIVHLANGKKPYEYGILVGLQLTREQLDYSKAHGPLGP
ncbi:MAG TPA: hypothetical protein VJ476_14765 [Rhizomicrobium sp.]|nr:hypothetical protein [Rhizomicrobium sp.]